MTLLRKYQKTIIASDLLQQQSRYNGPNNILRMIVCFYFCFPLNLVADSLEIINKPFS